MSTTHPFAGFNPKPSTWGYNWTVTEPDVSPTVKPARASPTQVEQRPSPEPMMVDQYANLPAALINTLRREKKPFTYTPGGVNLSEVLNARLQKRMERKKKYSEERAPKQVIVMPTYNTPIDMYSMENALEALEVQAELVAADKSLSAPCRSATLPRNHTFSFENDVDPAKGVTQSKAFRVLQIMTDTEEDMTQKPRQQHRDEMRFTGIRENKADIPSRFFHTLQKITGTDEEEEQPTTADAPVPSFEKQQYVSKAPFVAQQPQPQSFRPVPQPVQPNAAPATLKRPAAFLPIKTSQGFRPVQPPSISNGPLKRNTTVGGTDF